MENGEKEIHTYRLRVGKWHFLNAFAPIDWMMLHAPPLRHLLYPLLSLFLSYLFSSFEGASIPFDWDLNLRKNWIETYLECAVQGHCSVLLKWWRISQEGCKNARGTDPGLFYIRLSSVEVEAERMFDGRWETKEARGGGRGGRHCDPLRHIAIDRYLIESHYIK